MSFSIRTIDLLLPTPVYTMANMLTSPEVDLVTISFNQLGRINKIDQLPKLELLELNGFKSSELEDDKDNSML